MSTAFLVPHTLEGGLLLPVDKPQLAAVLGSLGAVDTPGGWSLWSALSPSDIPAAAPRPH